jgi:hypothetical protein
MHACACKYKSATSVVSLLSHQTEAKCKKDGSFVPCVWKTGMEAIKMLGYNIGLAALFGSW